MQTERTTVRLPTDLMIRARRKAAASGSTLTALIEEGLRQVVSATAEPSEAPRRLPRVSTAKGGVLPGVDLDRLSEIQEIEDIRYVARLMRSA